jgi:signal transduction histidine kinase
MSSQSATAPLRVLDPPSAAPPDARLMEAADREEGTQQLLAELSHDLRTPLASVRLLVGALRDGLIEPGGQDEYLAHIEEQVSVLTELADDLHAVAREQAVRRPRSDWTRTLELIEAAVEAMRIQAAAAGVVLEVDLPPCLPALRASSTELRRTLLNLIENAIRHARPGGKVVVRAEHTLCGVEIEIEDDGEGIATADRDRIFDAFYGADRRASLARSGLGLAIARATVEAHGGRIWLADTRCGTRVRFSLPASPERRPARRNGHARRRTSNEFISNPPHALKSQ